jgi:hypothetical protein
MVVDENKRLTVGDVINERENTHGDFENLSNVAQNIKSAYKMGHRYPDLKPYQREAVDLIATKLARIVCGDPNHTDNWLDGSGYFTLVLNELERDDE